MTLGYLRGQTARNAIRLRLWPTEEVATSQWGGENRGSRELSACKGGWPTEEVATSQWEGENRGSRELSACKGFLFFVFAPAKWVDLKSFGENKIPVLRWSFRWMKSLKYFQLAMAWLRYGVQTMLLKGHLLSWTKRDPKWLRTRFDCQHACCAC